MNELQEKANRPLAIGGVTVKNRVFLAPMAGYTDCAMRRLSAEAGAGLTVTEMVSAKGLVYGGGHSGDLLLLSSAERVKAVQLFGSDPAFFARAIALPALAPFDIIDINMGCPVPKVVRCGEGSALIRNPALAEKIVSACVKAAGGRPVTVKMRCGFALGEDVSAELGKRLAGAGAAAITLHARTREQGYSGRADWDIIERLASSLDIPVIGSGDASEQNLGELLGRASAVAIGRGAIGRPWIFARATGEKFDLDRKSAMLRHIEYLTRYYGERYATVNFRKFVAFYLGGMTGTRDLRLALTSARGTSELVSLLSRADI